jgi:putative MATE family efflux protein
MDDGSIPVIKPGDGAPESAAPHLMPKPKPLWRTFLVFLAPMMLANILQSLSGTLNNVFVGHMIGVDALAAATVFFPVMFFLIAFVMGLASGTTILIGQAFGRKDMARMRQIAGTSLALTVLGGTAVALVGGFFAEPLMAGLGTPEDIRHEATNYARIMLVSMPAMFVFILATSILRGVGDTVTPLWTLVASTIVGLIVTPAFISGWFGLPQLGVASAAVGSLVAMFVAMGWLFWHLRRTKHALAPDAELLAQVKLDPKILGLVLRLGLPTGVQMVIMALAELVLLGLVNAYGSEATAAYGTINQVLAYVQFPAMSIGIAASILGAQAIGAGKQDRLWAITRTGLVLNLIITGLGVAAVYLFSHAIVGMFITDAATAALTERLLWIVLWSTVVFGWAVTFSSMMRASGTVLAPTALSITAILAVEVPVAMIASKQVGVEGIWYGYPAAFCAMLVLQGGYYMLVWRRRTIKAIA